MTADRALFLLLRANAAVLLLAAPCALLPVAWMDAVHRDLLVLGAFPDAPLTRYLARSLSLVYALHGAVVLAVTLDWTRFRPLALVLAWLHVVFGGAMVVVDSSAGLPWWWVASEGPSVSLYGGLLLVLYRRANRSGADR